MRIMAKWIPPRRRDACKTCHSAEEQPVQRSSTSIIKPGFDVAQRGAPPQPCPPSTGCRRTAAAHAALMDEHHTFTSSLIPRPGRSANSDSARAVGDVMSSGWTVMGYCYLAAFFLIIALPAAPVAPLSSSPRPSPLLASNGLNRLASCQSRGLLWLCHKSARKNRNHLFRLGPERG